MVIATACAPAGLLHGAPAGTGAAGALPGIGRSAGQRLARHELSRAVYHQSAPLVDRVLRAIARWLGHLSTSARAVPGGWWGLVALAALAVIAAAATAAWLGPVARTRRGRRALAPAGTTRTARDHRDSADRLAEAGDYAGAIRERLRAIAAELDERGLLPSRPGWTAQEFAAQAARVVPEHAHGLGEGATLFDEVCYGKRPGTPRGCERLRALDVALRASAVRVRPASAEHEPASVGGRSP